MNYYIHRFPSLPLFFYLVLFFLVYPGFLFVFLILIVIIDDDERLNVQDLEPDYPFGWRDCCFLMNDG
jgi:hypothetical protein